MDSAGIRMVMMLAGTIEDAQGRLFVAGAQGHVKHVLELTQIHQVIPMYPDLASTLAALNDPAAPPA